MQYRELGRTGLRVSAVGLGCVQIGSSSAEYAERIVQRALGLGVTYFDTARDYWDSEIKLGRALAGRRADVVVSSKTAQKTREAAWREINESLERLQTNYLDNCHLHQLEAGADLERRLGPGGAIEALVQARDRGLVRHVGCTSHRADVLLAALDRFDFEVILVPMNFVEREPLAKLIPLCHERGIGVTIMKPLATGLLPATLALKWLLNQPIATTVPGATTLAEVEENCLVGHGDLALTSEEQTRITDLKAGLERVRCRICDDCLPCPQGIAIAQILGTDVLFDHHRTMGPAAFRAFPWSREAAERGLAERRRYIPAIESCTHCGECEERCPHGLPIEDMLQATLPIMRDMVDVYSQRLGLPA